MRLLIVGCDYAGKTTLVRRISRWMIDSMGLPYVRWHDHFVVPRLDRHLIVHAGADAPVVGKDESDLNTAEDEEQILSLRPMVLEQLQRHNVWRHLHPDSFREEDSLFVNHYYAEAVYAPLYYGYGEPGSFADRTGRARAWDRELLLQAPDIVLVLVECSPHLIRERMACGRRPRCILREQDADRVTRLFREQFDASLLPAKFSLDTSGGSPDEAFASFHRQVEPYLTDADRRRQATCRARQRS